MELIVPDVPDLVVGREADMTDSTLGTKLVVEVILAVELTKLGVTTTGERLGTDAATETMLMKRDLANFVQEQVRDCLATTRTNLHLTSQLLHSQTGNENHRSETGDSPTTDTTLDQSGHGYNTGGGTTHPTTQSVNQTAKKIAPIEIKLQKLVVVDK